MGVVDDVYSYLAAQALAGGATGWDLLRRRLMDAPAGDQLVVVSEDGGAAPEWPEAAGIGDSALTAPGVLVTVRAGAGDSDASYEKAQAIYSDLHGKRDVTLMSGGAQYLSIRSRTPEPIFAGFDDRSRPLHTVSFLLLREQS